MPTLPLLIVIMLVALCVVLVAVKVVLSAVQWLPVVLLPLHARVLAMA